MKPPGPGSFEVHELPGGFEFLTAKLPGEVLERVDFESLWKEHPATFPEIHMHGKRVRIPRWQQAFGVDYYFSGGVSVAKPVTAQLDPLLRWSKSAVDERLNGLLLNWYDGSLGHYIGAHRDSTKGVAAGSWIVTISLGERRTFRLRPWPRSAGEAKFDFETGHGSVFLLPLDTNKAFTHEVTASRRLNGRRISVTIRAFESRLDGGGS